MELLVIYKCPEGGFIVRQADMIYGPVAHAPLYATASIDDALRFIKTKMEAPANGR